MWNGTAPSLKLRPATMNTRPKISSTPLAECDLIDLATAASSSEPVAP